MRLAVSSSLLALFILLLWVAPAYASDFGVFANGQVNIVSSSHQDTAWMDSPAACRNFRIEHNILPALEMMRKDTNYTFCMECTLHVMEFLEAHPGLRGEVIQRMKEGRLEFGATYNQPYESWLSGEELIRQTYFGRRWIQRNLPGCDAKVAFNPDPPARSLQTQQILAKAGISYMFISRYHEGLYRWLSPDGSGILAYTPAHYYNHSHLLNGPAAKCLPAIQGKMAQQSREYEKRRIPPTYCLINSQDFSKPTDFRPLIEAWNAQPQPRPTMQYSSILQFFESVAAPTAQFNTVMGERPDVWAYITGPTHHWTSTVRREAAHLLPAAETFTSFASMLKNDFTNWPAKQLDEAWMCALYMDHGIGGKNGHITDEVFFQKSAAARDTGLALLDRALADIASQIKTEPSKGAPITVFNTLSWKRTGPVELAVNGAFHVVDESGREVPGQLTTLGEAEEINVAAGAKTAASSVMGADYSHEKVVDGRWNVCDPNPETGVSAKWNSARNDASPWLTIDFGRSRAIHKIVLRHEGVMGIWGGEMKFSTADFQLQCADSPEGPWADLIAPVTGNTAALTVHTFAPKSFRCLRLLVTKGSAVDSMARIYEVQAFEKTAPKQNLVFIAHDVPSLGYKTVYLVPGAPKQARVQPLENEFYRVRLAPGGIKSIYDKKLKRELLDTAKFLGGEVFTMLSVAPDNRSEGTDAGEFGRIPMPVMDASFDRVSTHKPEWKQIESGPVRSVWELEQPLADTTVRQRLVLWNTIRRVDCEADLKEFNGRFWREFRMALPLALENPQLAYEVPMGVVEIGKDEIPGTGGHAYGNVNYSDQCRDIHPRVVRNFVDASDARGGLMMSSSVSVFDWIDPTTTVAGKPVLQPVLLASRKSCNGYGVWYPQAGDHSYRFPLTSHAGGWRNAWREGIAANHPLIPVRTNPAAAAALPVEKSLCNVSADNVIISTLKKCEDDNSLVARLYDIEGRDATAKIQLFKPVAKAEKTSITEEGGASLPVKQGRAAIPVGHHAIETLKLKIAR